MRVLIFVLLFLLVFGGVAAVMLHQKGLLSGELLILFREPEPVPELDEDLAQEEPLGLAASIQKKKQTLDEETQRLQELATRLAAERADLAAERDALGKQVRELKPMPESEPEPGAGAEPLEPSEELVELVKIYETMDPDAAASILENMPDPTVAQILLQMRRRQASLIMGSLSSNKAAEVSKLLVSKEVSVAQ